MVGKMSMGLDPEILLKYPNVDRETGSFVIFSSPFFFSSYSHYTFSSIFFSFITFLFFLLFFTPHELKTTLVLPWQPPA
jgi:hypothetical protein